LAQWSLSSCRIALAVSYVFSEEETNSHQLCVFDVQS
jgi:hypothetical protein